MSTPKEKGDAALRLSDWKGAIDSYTVGITDDPNSPESGLLYSNRAAAYVQTCEFDRALLDAASCCRSLPTSSKGYLRAAEAYGRVREYKESIACYAAAMKLAETPDVKQRYNVAKQMMNSVMQKQEARNVRFSESEGKLRVIDDQRLEALSELALVKNNNAFGISSAQNYWIARSEASDGVDLLSESPSLEDTINTTHNWANAILTDQAVFSPESLGVVFNTFMAYLKSSRDVSFPGFKCYTWRDIKARSPIECILEVDQVRLSSFNGDWAPMRTMLNFTIRSMIVNAKINHDFGRHHEAFCLYMTATYLCTEGNVHWDVYNDNCLDSCGEVFSLAFSRALHGVFDCFHKKIIDLDVADLKKLVTPVELRERASGLINAMRLDHEHTFTSASHRLLGYSIPLSGAHEHLGDLAVADSWIKPFKAPQQKLSYANHKLSIEAAKEYRIAASLIPCDALNYTRNLCSAVMSDIRAGGKTINYILDKFAEIEESRKKLTAWYGPPFELEISDSFIRGVMGIIRKWLNHQSICCCRKSTREIDLRHTIRAWPLTEVKVTEKMFEVGKYDLKMRSVTSLNGGKCVCQNKECSDNHIPI